MSEYFAEINGNIDNDLFISANLSDLLNISANIAAVDDVSCEISDIFEIAGTIGTICAVTADLQIPNTIHATIYDGQYEVDPKAFNSTILDTNGKTLLEDVVVNKIPYYETSNLASGYTVYIASEVN